MLRKSVIGNEVRNLSVKCAGCINLSLVMKRSGLIFVV